MKPTSNSCGRESCGLVQRYRHRKKKWPFIPLEKKEVQFQRQVPEVDEVLIEKLSRR
jgi:hypothetical protein